MSVLADAYHKKSRLCEHLADHHRMTGQIPLARQYEQSAVQWRAKARKVRNEAH